jgi:uncharacterized DUF497 family protein
MSPLFEYDPEKSQKNKERHGIDFDEAQELWKVPHTIFPAKASFGEVRYFILGQLFGRVYMAIFTYRGLLTRIISCHKADERWIREYEREKNDTEKGKAD